ncbi:KH domain-containing protein [Candidatus Peregrinibacteria bacterium]|nr:KH domain-containing protein [Candidatus Peregrinibacteria bacterium]
MEDIIKETLENILKKMSIHVKKIQITEDKKEKRFRVNIESEDSSMLIGYHGETMYSLQHLLKSILWKKGISEEYNLFLDVDKYRKRQEESVVILAERKAEQVRKTGRSVMLLPMSGYFRRLVHLHLAEKGFEDIETESIGEGDHRQVVIKLKNHESPSEKNE